LRGRGLLADDDKIQTKDLFWFIGIFISEGSFNKHHADRMEISQYKEKNPVVYKKILNILKTLNIKYYIDNEEKKFAFHDKKWKSFFSTFFKNSFECKIPDWCFDYDYSLLKYLHDGLYQGDGNKGRVYRYNTVSEELKNDFIKLNLHLGYRVTCSKEDYITKVNKLSRTIWRIHRPKGCWYRGGDKLLKPKIIKNPTNKIVCCSVKDNHTLLAGRNGRLVWTGNSFYGLVGNPVFKTLYNPTSAADCTHIARTLLKKFAKTLEEYGFTICYGFTDNIIIKIPDNIDKGDLTRAINKYMKEVKSHFKFPLDSFKMDLEREMKFIWFVSKNCYLWVDDKDKVEYKATLLNINRPPVVKMLFNEYVAPKIIKELDVNFTEEELLNKIKEMLKENIEIAAEEYSVREADTYKSKTALHRQISEKYGPGRHKLIPNLKGIGIGKQKDKKEKKGVRYCNYEDFIENKLTVEDIDMTKIMKDFKRFILRPIMNKIMKKRREEAELKEKGLRSQKTLS
jgi:DNA polymerase elongation subunit (family B)